MAFRRNMDVGADLQHTIVLFLLMVMWCAFLGSHCAVTYMKRAHYAADNWTGCSVMIQQPSH